MKLFIFSGVILIAFAGDGRIGARLEKSVEISKFKPEPEIGKLDERLN